MKRAVKILFFTLSACAVARAQTDPHPIPAYQQAPTVAYFPTVAAGTYGSTNTIPVFTFNAQGQLATVSSVAASGGTSYNAGAGILISGSTISNAAPDQIVSLADGGIVTISGTYPNFTITGNEADGSITNEIQTLSIAGQNLTLSNGGGTVAIPSTTYTSGAGISINGSNVISATDASATNETNTAFSVAAGNLSITDASGTLSVTTAQIAPIQAISEGAGVGVSISGTTATITNTGDLSNTNEIELPSQTGNGGKYLTTDGTNPAWATVSGGTYTQGSGISITANVISATDASITNEGSLTVGAGGAHSSTVVSNTSGSTAVTIAAGGGIDVTESGGTVTISGKNDTVFVAIQPLRGGENVGTSAGIFLYGGDWFAVSDKFVGYRIVHVSYSFASNGAGGASYAAALSKNQSFAAGNTGFLVSPANSGAQQSATGSQFSTADLALNDRINVYTVQTVAGTTPPNGLKAILMLVKP